MVGVYAIVALVFLAAVTSAGMSVTLAATVREVRSERDPTRINGVGRVGLVLTGIPVLWFLATAVRNTAVPLSAVPLTAVWQERTPPSIQASVFGARRLIGQGGYPLAILIGGWMGGRLAPVTSLAGTGLGGLAGLILLSGIGEVGLGALLLLTPSIREIIARPAEKSAAPDARDLSSQ